LHPRKSTLVRPPRQQVGRTGLPTPPGDGSRVAMGVHINARWKLDIHASITFLRFWNNHIRSMPAIKS